MKVSHAYNKEKSSHLSYNLLIFYHYLDRYPNQEKEFEIQNVPVLGLAPSAKFL